jgi:hypothetical protein
MPVLVILVNDIVQFGIMFRNKFIAEPCTSSSLALSRVLTMTLLMLLSPSLHVALAPLSGSLVTGLSRVTLSFAPSPLSLPFLPRLWFLL